LATLIFNGSNLKSTEDDANQAIEDNQKTSTRRYKDRTSDYSKFYVHWMFQRYQKETGFVPFIDRGIHTLRIEATRSALRGVVEAFSSHYKYAVVSLRGVIIKYFCPLPQIHH